MFSKVRRFLHRLKQGFKLATTQMNLDDRLTEANAALDKADAQLERAHALGVKIKQATDTASKTEQDEHQKAIHNTVQTLMGMAHYERIFNEYLELSQNMGYALRSTLRSNADYTVVYILHDILDLNETSDVTEDKVTLMMNIDNGIGMRGYLLGRMVEALKKSHGFANFQETLRKGETTYTGQRYSAVEDKVTDDKARYRFEVFQYLDTWNNANNTNAFEWMVEIYRRDRVERLDDVVSLRVIFATSETTDENGEFKEHPLRVVCESFKTTLKPTELLVVNTVLQNAIDAFVNEIKNKYTQVSDKKTTADNVISMNFNDRSPST